MNFQDEPRSTTGVVLPELEITAVEVQALLADPSGHGMSNYLIEHAPQFVMSGGCLRTPYRVLWYAENLGLAKNTYSGQHKDSYTVRLRDVLDQVNQSNASNGKKTVAMGTVLNGLSPLAKTLLQAFKVKVLINRQDETIKILSEAFAANMFTNMRADAERIFKRYNDVIEQANAVGVPTKGLIAGTEVERTARLVAAA
jgi:hypothetical protein